ncbi:S-adenosyl-L-methionine-dependent methyltransferase MidA [Artemisia annua]|uniref:type II protein arginine methyltransferase n=1 Tax=Artemisia annua TaxID=35608 RepID=A0A2U1NBZ3_ARTAN|nr:S-adenosyl-L-methionine-dependent methyltransferase MidA [Artemisia annua]
MIDVAEDSNYVLKMEIDHFFCLSLFRFCVVLSPQPTPATLYLLKRCKTEELKKLEHVEVCLKAMDLTQSVAKRISSDGGGALITDYGLDGIVSDSLQIVAFCPLAFMSRMAYAHISWIPFLQAIRKHKFVDMLDDPGSTDLSVYVDFHSQFLGNLGINFHVEALLQNCTEEQAESLQTGYWRLLAKEDDVDVPNESNAREANVAYSSKSRQRAPSKKLPRKTGIWSSKRNLSLGGFEFGKLGDSDEGEVFEPNDDMSRQLEKEDDVDVPNESNAREANVASSSKSRQRAPSKKLPRKTGIWSSKRSLSPGGFEFGKLGDSDEGEVFEPNDDMSSRKQENPNTNHACFISSSSCATPLKKNPTTLVRNQDVFFYKIQELHMAEAPLSNEQLCPSATFVPYQPNNYYVDFKTLSAEHGVILEILKGHPISYALSTTTQVPEIYIQELWNSMTYREDEDTPYIRGTINRVSVKITKKTIRSVLKFPRAKSREGMEEFEPFVNVEDLAQDVRSLGYDAASPFTAPSHFKKRKLATLWSTLFMLINRCLTWKKVGQDKCSVDTLMFFHGIAFNRHYDFAELIWRDLVSLVTEKDKREFVPFIRFIKLIIAEFMNKHPDMILRPYGNCPKDTSMQRIPSNCGHRTVRAMRIPDELLAYADPRAQVVIDYRLAYPSLVPVEGEVRTESREPLAKRVLNIEGFRGVNDTVGKLDRSHTESISPANTSAVDPPSVNTPDAPTPPDHLDTSLQVPISSTLRAKPNDLPPNPVGIETEDVLLHYPPPKSVGLEEVEYVIRNYNNIHEDSTDDARLNDLATTAVLESKLDTSRGSAGSPGGVIINKAPTSGHLVESSARVRTEIPISGFQSLKDHIDRKGQSSTSSQELPADEYKKYTMEQLSSMLRSKILDETKKTDTQQSLLELIKDFVQDRSHPATQENIDELHDTLHSAVDRLTSQVEKLTKEVHDLRSGCKPDAIGTKRTHEDPNSDNYEGEKDVKASGVSTQFFKDLREISSNDVVLIVFIMKIVRMMQVYSVLQDNAMGLVLSAANVRGWTTGSGMEGPPVTADGSGENISMFPWSPRRRMRVAFTCNMCGKRTTRSFNPHAYKYGSVFVQVKLSGSFM